MSDPFAVWCVTEADACATVETLLESYAALLGASGVPVFRINVPLRAMHPQVRIMSYTWRRADGRATAQTRPRLDAEWRTIFEHSPFKRIYEDGERLVRRRLIDPNCPRDFGILADLEAAGVTDYVVLTGRFADTPQAVTFATNAPEGFDSGAIASLQASLPAFLLRLDLLYTREVARIVTNTYIGARTGPRVLAGDIHRGAVHRLDAVVAFTDLRGFTARSAGLSPVDVTAFLNEWFERVEDEACARGGEILKLIGDAALVVWPVVDDDAATACRAALDTAASLTARLSRETDLRCGMGLHYGEVAYGNIGGRERLDFTVIGAAVNTASRLEGLCGTLGLAYVMSKAVARHARVQPRPLGAHVLKGVPEPVEVFGPP
jgi:adenylate cyclase